MSIRSAQVLEDIPSPPRTQRPASASADRAPREMLLAHLADNPNLPSPPGVVLQILEKASRLDCRLTELAALIHRDPVLCGKILKTVNSALYSLPRSITSIERIVALLGLKSLRSLVLSLSLPAMQRQAGAAPPLETFWKESVAGAIIAQELAIHLRRPNAEDDLVAGLLRDLGVLVLHQMDSAAYARVLAHPLSELVQNQCRLEEELLGIHHAEASALLLQRWRLPEDITEAIRYHHTRELPADLPRPIAERARLLAFASRIAQLQLGASESELLRDILEQAREYYGMSEADLSAFLEPIAKKIQEFAALMNLDIGSCAHYPSIIARAAEELIKLTLETSMDQLRTLEQKRQAEQETQHWREEAHRLHHETLRDPLTDAFNRGCLEDELVRRFRRARRRGTVLGLVFLDIDDFKNVNDCFGHLVGDQALREMADHLFAAVRHGDLVARYGGDEFCILIENTSANGLHAMADRLLKDLNELTIRADGHNVTIRASIGIVMCMPRSYASSAVELLDLADRAMYAAKTTGKNQITFVSLLSEADNRFLQAVESRLFSVWLAERQVWKPRHLGIGVRRAGARFEAAGRMARRLGWLTAAQLRPILREQRATRRCFDEIALERGGLTNDQLAALLALQLEPPEELAANLANQGIADEAAMREHLRKYSQWLRSTLG